MTKYLKIEEVIERLKEIQKIVPGCDVTVMTELKEMNIQVEASVTDLAHTSTRTIVIGLESDVERPLSPHLCDTFEVRCQRCDGSKDKGCGSCGGYGFTMYKRHCPGCGQPFWGRPGVYTSYDGKQYYSLDGLLITQHHKDGEFSQTCAKCK